jgi:hypothetical protein
MQSAMTGLSWNPESIACIGPATLEGPSTRSGTARAVVPSIASWTPVSEGNLVDRVEVVGFIYPRYSERVLVRPAAYIRADGTIVKPSRVAGTTDGV